MPRLRRSIVVNAPPHRLWAVISSPEELALHCTPEGRLTPKIDRVEITSPQRSGAGLAWKVSGEFGGEPFWAEHRAVAWEEGRRLAYAILRDSQGAHERMRAQVETYELEDLGNGTTRVTRTSTFRLGRLGLRLLYPLLFRRIMSRTQLASLHKLKAWVEGEQAPEGR